MERLRAVGVGHLVLALLLVVALVRLHDTGRSVGLTHDEPAHLATGIEWLDRGSYRYEPQHPPLARIAIATGPWLDGRRTLGQPDLWSEGYGILLDGPGLQRTLALARLGVVPFFLLAVIGAWWWGKRLGGTGAGVASALLVSTLPSMLAHGALATTDVPLTGMLVATTVLIVRWFEKPGAWSSISLGITAGLTLLTKHSSLLFLAVAGTVILASWVLGRRRAAPAETPRSWLRDGSLVLLGAALMVWAGYRFSVGSRADLAFPEERRAGTVPAVSTEGGGLIPAPEYIAGIREIKEHTKKGHRAFLLGEVRYRGWWYFFPVALLVKTPLPFLLLTLAGIVYLARWPPGSWLALVPPLTAAGIMLAVMPSPINIGLRHILPVYPFLAAVAGTAAVAIFRAKWRAAIPGKIAVTLLLTWQVISSARAHPDYLTWFNLLPGSRPDLVLVDSDLDWGQDMTALADTLRARGAGSVTLAGALNRAPEPFRTRLGFPPSRTMPAYTWTPGFVAVDLYGLRIGELSNWRIPSDGYAWVARYEPVARVGKTIRLYRFPSTPDSAVQRRGG